jgi:ribose 5-phosphate isomerase
MLTINNKAKISNYQIGNKFIIDYMVEVRANYHIFVTDENGLSKDLKLNRMKGRRGKYRLTYGNFLVDLPFSDIQNIDTFSSHIKRLIC